MGPKVEAACRFVAGTGKAAAIGALKDLGVEGMLVVGSVPDALAVPVMAVCSPLSPLR